MTVGEVRQDRRKSKRANSWYVAEKGIGKRHTARYENSEVCLKYLQTCWKTTNFWVWLEQKKEIFWEKNKNFIALGGRFAYGNPEKSPSPHLSPYITTREENDIIL